MKVNKKSKGIWWFSQGWYGRSSLPTDKSANKGRRLLSLLHGLIILAVFLSTAWVPYEFSQSVKASKSKLIERGRYLVKIAGCNDCHTAGYPEAGG